MFVALCVSAGKETFICAAHCLDIGKQFSERGHGLNVKPFGMPYILHVITTLPTFVSAPIVLDWFGSWVQV